MSPGRNGRGGQALLLRDGTEYHEQRYRQMIFKGWLRSPGETHKGLPVVLDIEETGVTVSTGDRELGWWAPNDVALERGEGTHFLFQVDGEHWFFEPSDAMRLLFEGIPLLNDAQFDGRGASKRNLRGRQRDNGRPAAAPQSERHDEPAIPSGGVSVIPSVVWGLMTAALLFFGVLVGVLVGRFRADGRNLLTGVMVFSALLIGFVWGRMLWTRASRRRVTRPAPVGSMPKPRSTLGELPKSRLDRLTGGNPSSHGPAVDDQGSSLLPAIVARNGRSSGRDGSLPRDRGLKIRGDETLIGMLGNGGRGADKVLKQPIRSDVPAPDLDKPDDLQAIKGIGPVSEKTLKSLGYTTYEDVALLTTEQIEELQRHLGNFKNRIYTDGWCLSAARLHRQKYGAFPARKLEADRS